MPQLVFATNNAHKLEEVADILKHVNSKEPIQLLSLNDINCHDDIEETGTTFIANASIKSQHIYNKYHLNCFGDDSGLEIEGLNGEPGVYSARYAGKHGDHPANIAKVLKNLDGVTNRKARFITVISLIWNDEEHLFEGVINGTIRREVAGHGGFGYDPIFQPDGYDITFAEMSLEQKSTISHRAIAVEKLVTFLGTI